MAGTNDENDVDIYAFDPCVSAKVGFLHSVAVNSTDQVLQSLLRTDIAGNKWVAGWENHVENLPEDPTQVKQSYLAIFIGFSFCGR